MPGYQRCPIVASDYIKDMELFGQNVAQSLQEPQRNDDHEIDSHISTSSCKSFSDGISLIQYFINTSSKLRQTKATSV